jgi:hypothetical protein
MCFYCISTAALQSVFPQTELGTFLALQKRDKERQIHELTMIVTGIRLFNKDCGKGGEGIDDCTSLHFHSLFLCSYRFYFSNCLELVFFVIFCHCWFNINYVLSWLKKLFS